MNSSKWDRQVIHQRMPGADERGNGGGNDYPWNPPGIAPGNGPGNAFGAGAWTQVVRTHHAGEAFLRWKPLAPPWQGCLDTLSGVIQGVWGCFLVSRVLVRLVRRDHQVIRAPQGCPGRPGVPGEPRAPWLPATPRR